MSANDKKIPLTAPQRRLLLLMAEGRCLVLHKGDWRLYIMRSEDAKLYARSEQVHDNTVKALLRKGALRRVGANTAIMTLDGLMSL